MNKVKKFDLRHVNFKVPLTTETDQSVVAKRKSFYRVQMDHLKKTAEPWDLERDPG